MKRDWDVIRKQLTDIEGEKDLFSDFPDRPKWEKQDEATFINERKKYREIEALTFGHLDLLINAGYVDGLRLIEVGDGSFVCSGGDPKLTMAGHDLLETIRSDTLWNKIKTTAKDKGIELTLDAVKALAAFALKSVLE